MKRPKMLLFDAGKTLVNYESVDTLKGVQALLPYITFNPRCLTAEQIDALTNEIFSVFDESRRQLFEVPVQTILTLVYDLLGLQFSISIAEIEEIIWDNDSQKIPTKHVAKLLTYLSDIGIETAVLSNLDFSGYLLRKTLDKLFPENHFRFVTASSDYGIRKPRRLIFDAAIQKSGFPPEEIWYIGDKIPVDVAGSKAAGMIPVLYRSSKNHYAQIPEDLIVITDFLELIDILEKTT